MSDLTDEARGKYKSLAGVVVVSPVLLERLADRIDELESAVEFSRDQKNVVYMLASQIGALTHFMQVLDPPGPTLASAGVTDVIDPFCVCAWCTGLVQGSLPAL